MDVVFKRISEIEAVAQQVLANAKDTIKKMDADMEKQTQAFDQDLEEATQKKAEALKNQLQESNMVALKKIQTDADLEIQSLYENFEKNHDVMAEKIFQKIIKG